MTWNGAGGWVIASQRRQVNFSRTVWITFHCRGTTSSVSVMSSPSLASLPPQHGQALPALGRLTVPVALHLGDQEPQMRHHCLGAGSPGLGLLPRRALGRKRRL